MQSVLGYGFGPFRGLRIRVLLLVAKSGLFVGGSSESLQGLRLRVLPLVVAGSFRALWVRGLRLVAGSGLTAVYGSRYFHGLWIGVNL